MLSVCFLHNFSHCFVLAIMFARNLSITVGRRTTLLKGVFQASASTIHTTSHIPVLKANMKNLDAVLNPSDRNKHDTTVGGGNACSLRIGYYATWGWRHWYSFSQLPTRIGFFMVPYAADLSRSLPTVRFMCPTAPGMRKETTSASVSKIVANL